MTGANDDAAWRPPAAPARPAEELEGYADLVELGRGGDSVVYRARDLAVGRDVAVKVLAVDDPARVARFLREIEITVSLGRQHPNIVNLLAVGTTSSGRPAIVMDLYERGSLHDQLRDRGPLSVEEVVAAGTVVADALAFAHEHGVLHRDVKPQNVLVLPTSWVLADFGIARLVDTEHTASVETFTYRHASPQLLDGMAPSAADDVWALGSTLFTLLDGRPPFASDDPDEDSALAYLRRVRTERHRGARAHDGQGDATALLAVVDRCLAKDLDERWGSAAELRDALAAVRVQAWEPGAAPVRAAPAPSPEPAAAEPEPQPEEVPPAPAPEPSPLALSVLAHGVPPADEAPTGTRPPTAPAPAATPAAPLEPAPPADPARRSRRRTLLVLGAAALLVGGVLGLFGSLLRDDEPDDPAPAAGSGPTGQPVPELTTAPTETGPPQPDVTDPALAFTFTDIRSDGLTLSLEWTDSAEGVGTVVLTQTLPEFTFVRQFDPGATEAEIALPLAYGVRACFVLSVVTPDGRVGLSQPNRRCVTPEP